jgi:hypothetical protein
MLSTGSAAARALSTMAIDELRRLTAPERALLLLTPPPLLLLLPPPPLLLPLTPPASLRPALWAPGQVAAVLAAGRREVEDGAIELASTSSEAAAAVSCPRFHAPSCAAATARAFCAAVFAAR